MKIMKGFFSVLLSIGLFSFSACLGDKAPQKVKEAFQKKFPTVSSVEWEKESETEWEAEFKMDKIKYSANFSENGTWIETEHEVRKKDIPKNVYNSLMIEFPGYEIEGVEISETKDGSFYEFEIERKKKTMEVVIDKNAKIIKKTKVDERD